MNADEIVKKLESLGSPENVAGMARYGIVTKKAFGVAAPQIREIANAARKAAPDRHKLALELWETGILEARGVAYLVEDPKNLTSEQMEKWAADFDNWAICDGTCGHLFCRSELAYAKVLEWSARDEEFVKRAGICLMAWLAVHDKKATDERIAEFLPLLEELADDDRNFIKKAVNWSLRQIGKRSRFLNELAIETAHKIRSRNTKAARWIASDALRELTSEKVQARVLRT